MPPLKLIPGLACDAAMWQSQLPFLKAAGYDVSVSDVHTRAATLPDMAALLLQEMASAQFIPIGASMGAMIAMHAALQAPDRIAAMALLGVSAAADSPAMQRLRLDAIERFRRGEAMEVLQANLPLAFHPLNPTPPAMQQAYIDMVMRAGAEQLIAQNQAVLARKDLRPALPEINCPTLILCGEGDAITPLEGASEIAQALPMAEFHSLQHAGHMLCWEQPEEVNNHLLKWLKRIRPHLGIAVTVF